MGVLAAVVVLLAAALHVAIFWMESVGWTRPAVWRRFGLSTQADADTTRPLAYNQGFYNLFLAIGAIVGVVLTASGGGLLRPGIALIVMSTGSMVLAAAVLLTTGRGYLRAALTQGTAPLIGLLLTLIAHA